MGTHGENLAAFIQVPMDAGVGLEADYASLWWVQVSENTIV